ncbi:hypothetical protein QNH48_15495 [Neobacillus sp. YX16]|uniref:hypothetical protein n=1 Tax=Neobacillus sp. YX16 TaxID=3047874 RepID=UPI0024C2764A|nr:hypothetical protein [Neobacillus sp. YX16]WHZ00480.1 hypothetical protein QNH48_15495 [Neobacillus sp. YX16]
MSNKIKQEMNRIEIPKELSERSKIGIHKAKKEMQNGRKRYSLTSIGIVAGLLLSIGTFALFNNNVFSPNGTTDNQNTPIATNSDAVKIPAIQLPKGNSIADMIGLIVYNGKIYTQTRTELDAENAKVIVGEKLGTTKGTIDEWSKQEAYDEEFASTIGIADVFSVKGYGKDFRIMTYGELDGKPYAEFYENLNGITINSGEDVFGKLKMVGNVSSADYRTFSDWDNSVENYNPIADMKILNDFVEELNKTKPFPRGENSDPISNSRNNEEFRELTIQLNDGTKVKLILLKNGYIYYGYMGAYFKMNDDIFSKIWSQL